MWIIYVYCSANITYLRSPVRTRSSLSKPGSDTKKTLSRPAYQNTMERRRNESQRHIYARKIPHVYTLSLKQPEQVIKSTMVNQYRCNMTYKHPRIIHIKSWKKDWIWYRRIKESTETRIKEARIPESKREKLQLLAKRTITWTPEQYKKVSKILDVRIQGRQKRPDECVCVKEKMLVHNNNVSNNNMINWNKR